MQEHDETGLDLRDLSDFIIQLNISRRHAAAYPKEHPIIALSAGKAFERLRRLHETSGSLTLGVAESALLVGDSFLDRGNAVYGDLARALFDRGIAVVTFQEGTSPEEILRFSELVGRSQDRPDDIEQWAAEAGLSRIQVRGINFDHFRTTEVDRVERPTDARHDRQSAFLWETFVQGLMKGILDPTGGLRPLPGSMDPEKLAELLNTGRASGGHAGEEDYESVIASFLRTRLEGRTAPEPGRSAEFAEKLSALVNRLNPDLRRRFLRGAFRALPSREEGTEGSANRLSEGSILDALAEANSRQDPVSLPLWGVLQKLSGSPGAIDGKVLGAPEQVCAESADLLENLFARDRHADYIPEGYQKTLGALVSGDRLPVPPLPEIESLKDSLAGPPLESRFGHVVLELLRAGPEEGDETAGTAARNLQDLCRYFLEIGDFAFLATIYRHLKEMDGVPAAREVREIFETPEFRRAFSESARLWGKSKFSEIRRLIREVGTFWVEPLLDCLAEERSIPLRRFYIEALVEMGDAIKSPVIARLKDGRWYVVRNLVLILYRLGDPGVLASMHRLSTHPHFRVRQEVLKAYLHFNAPEGDRILLEELDSQDRDRQLFAIHQAEKSGSRQVFEKLLALLRRKTLSGPDLELKIAVVRTLGTIGDAEALPEVEKLLWSRNLLYPRIQQRLKMEIAGTLGRYPADSTAELIRKLARAGQTELVRTALGTENPGGNA